MEITVDEQNKGKRMEVTEYSLGNFWDNIKCTTIEIMSPEEEYKKKSLRKILKRL